MPSPPYRVIIVVDPNFGEELAELPSGVPVWIVDTAANASVARRLWAERPSESHLTGITTFRADPNSSREEHLIGPIPNRRRDPTYHNPIQ
jgi:hypothetical protein